MISGSYCRSPRRARSTGMPRAARCTPPTGFISEDVPCYSVPMSSATKGEGESGAASTVVEAAVESLDDALAAVSGGADRLELCGDLSVGGTTPDIALIEAVVARVDTPVVVMIRPRGGGFVYTARELDEMRRDVERSATLGAAGVVLGVLNARHHVDEAQTRMLIAAAGEMAVTFHRAFDLTPDPLASIDVLQSLGASRVLSSGARDSARDGAGLLRDMVTRAGDRLIVVAGGGVRAHNVREIVEVSGVREVHLRCERDASRIRAVKQALAAPTSFSSTPESSSDWR